MLKRPGLWVAVVAAVAAWFLLPWAKHQVAMAILASRAPVVKNAAPSFALKNSSGATVRLADYAGKVVLLNFWATWCGPCKTETPWFVDFQKKWAGDGFTVVGVSMDDDGWPVIDPWLKEQKVNYPVLLGNSEISEAYDGVDALPTTFVIGRNGSIAYIHRGLIPKAQYEREIAGLLAERR